MNTIKRFQYAEEMDPRGPTGGGAKICLISQPGRFQTPVRNMLLFISLLQMVPEPPSARACLPALPACLPASSSPRFIRVWPQMGNNFQLDFTLQMDILIWCSCSNQAGEKQSGTV